MGDLSSQRSYSSLQTLGPEEQIVRHESKEEMLLVGSCTRREADVEQPTTWYPGLDTFFRDPRKQHFLLEVQDCPLIGPDGGCSSHQYRLFSTNLCMFIQ
jgi:hypothetical protein